MINTEGLKDFDPAEYLDDAPSIAAYLDEAFKTENPEYISHALGVAAKAKGMTDIAQKSGIRREQAVSVSELEREPDASNPSPCYESIRRNDWGICKRYSKSSCLTSPIKRDPCGVAPSKTLLSLQQQNP